MPADSFPPELLVTPRWTEPSFAAPNEGAGGWGVGGLALELEVRVWTYVWGEGGVGGRGPFICWL